MLVKAGKFVTSVQLPPQYYPETATTSFIEGSKIVTSTEVGSTSFSYITATKDMYLVSVEINVDTHQYQNFYTLEIVDGKTSVTKQIIANKIYDSGQKVLPFAIPVKIDAGDKLKLSIFNTVGVSQIVIWHASFIY